jgi:hypothetical protein
MTVKKNEEHNSIELDFGGVKPSEQARTLMKAYGFWWFAKGKCWCHTLDVDGEFFEKFVEERIKPLVASAPVTVDAIKAALPTMSEEDRQAALAALMGGK